MPKGKAVGISHKFPQYFKRILAGLSFVTTSEHTGLPCSCGGIVHPFGKFAAGAALQMNLMVCSAGVGAICGQDDLADMLPHSADRTAATTLLVEFDDSWRPIFEKERARIVDASGLPLASIEHFGSTAIPNLRAKPVIDMMAPVASLIDGERHGAMLQDMGYGLVEADFSKRVLFRREDVTARLAFHLHLVVCPSWPAKNELLFRNWLIDHVNAADAYAALKQRLADQCGDDMRRYTMGKSEFVRSIVAKARIAAGLPPETDWSE